MFKKDASLYINNTWKPGNGPILESHNPATGRLLWHKTSAGAIDIDEAVSSSQAAFQGWSNLSFKERCNFITAFSEELISNQTILAEIISKEMGKPLWESKTELTAMIQKASISIDAQIKRCSIEVKEHPLGSLITRHKPHGVIAVFGPFNFPGHLPNGHIIPALLAGNTVIFKPSEFTPWTAEEIIGCWERIGLPPGVISLLQGGPDVGKKLVEHAGINGFLFTGSYHTGSIISAQLSSTPEKLLALEMGGNNPLIIDQITDIDAAVYAIIQSAYVTSGQRCTCAKRLIIIDEVADPLLKLLKEKVSKIHVGPYDQIPEPFMGPVVSQQTAIRLLEKQDHLTSLGGKQMISMKLLQINTGLLSPGLIDVTGIDIPDEEIFGPLLQVIRVNNFENAIKEASKTSYGLSAGLFSDNPFHYEHFKDTIKAGIINWNTPLTGASSWAPFGGVGKSGNFRPGAYYTADYCSYPTASIEAPRITIPEKPPPGLG